MRVAVLPRGVRLLLLAAVCVAIAAPDPVTAQYAYIPPEPNQKPVNVYFGSAKDGSGNYMPGVTVVLRTKQADFVAVTDVRGRFRLELPLDVHPDDVKASCSRTGYTLKQIVTRTPHGHAITPVEVGCVLNR